MEHKTRAVSRASGSLNPENSTGAPDPAAFAPADPTDNRAPLDWQSKYPREARRQMWIEGSYLAGLLVSVPLLLIVLWLEVPKTWLGLSREKYAAVLKYGVAWLGGLLGGTLFSLKWLYHSIARQIWHVDRRPWRVFTPHISAGLAFAVVALISSGLFRIFDRGATNARPLVLGVAFLVGYFSDSAIAKLSEIAETLFGASRAKEKHLDTRGNSAAGKQRGAYPEEPQNSGREDA
jgi:hypothetical protein